SAVSSVNADTLPLAVFDTGHNEMMDTTLYKNLLTSNNFETQEINLLTDEIPENAQLFVLATPATDYTPDEIEKLEAFLNDEEGVRPLPAGDLLSGPGRPTQPDGLPKGMGLGCPAIHAGCGNRPQ